MATTGVTLGVKTRSAIAAKRCAPTPINTSGSNAAKAGSRATTRAKDLSAVAMRSLKVAAISLNARYCNSLANNRSRASSRARSSSSSTSPDGSNRAAFKSSKVAATTRNSVACSSSQPSPEASRPRINEMNSSVTMLKETSVTSIL